MPHLWAPCACGVTEILLCSCNGMMRRPWCATARSCMCCRQPAARGSSPSCTACRPWRCTQPPQTASCSQGRTLLWWTTESWHAARVSAHTLASVPACTVFQPANNSLFLLSLLSVLLSALTWDWSAIHGCGPPPWLLCMTHGAATGAHGAESGYISIRAGATACIAA